MHHKAPDLLRFLKVPLDNQNFMRISNTPTIPDDLIDRLYAVIRPVLGTTNPADMSAAFQRLFPEPGVLDVPDKFKPADVTAKDYLPFIVGLYLGSKLAQEFEIHLQGGQ